MRIVLIPLLVYTTSLEDLFILQCQQKSNLASHGHQGNDWQVSKTLIQHPCHPNPWLLEPLNHRDLSISLQHTPVPTLPAQLRTLLKMRTSGSVRVAVLSSVTRTLSRRSHLERHLLVRQSFKVNMSAPIKRMPRAWDRRSRERVVWRVGRSRT